MSTKAMSPEVKEVFLFWLCLALTLIGLGYFLQQVQRYRRSSVIEQESIVYTCPDIVLTEEEQQAKRDFDRRTRHIWLNRNALLLMRLEEEHGIQFDRRLFRLWSHFGIDGIASLLEIKNHPDVNGMLARIED